MKTNFKNKKGFTLIELLVVIAIISLLSSVILASLNSARSKARDAVRIADLQEIQKALELYYSNHGDYPPSSVGGAGCWANWQGGNAANGSSVQFLQPLVTDGIMTQVPLEKTSNMRDGWGTQCTYRYGRYDLSAVCGPSYSNVAVLYTALENAPPGNGGRQPACLSGAWGEGGAGVHDWLILLNP